MAAALGLLTGMGIGAAAGEIRQKRQQKQKHDDALFGFYSQHPDLVADNPDAQKFVTGYGGKDVAQAFIGMAQHTKAAIEHFKMAENTTAGGGGMGGAPTGGQGAPQLPTTSGAIQTQIAITRRAMEDPNLPEQWRKIGEKHLEELNQEYGRLRTDEIRQLAEQRKPGVAAAVKQADIDTELKNAPALTAAAAKRAGAVGAAGEAGRESVALSEATTAKKQKQEEALLTTKQQVMAKVGKPWTEKDSLAARSSALRQADMELTKPNRFLPGSSKPSPEAREAKAKDILLSEGLDPGTGKRLEDGDVVRLPNGKKLIWRDHPTAATGG